jgi:hypothetical protein
VTDGGGDLSSQAVQGAKSGKQLPPVVAPKPVSILTGGLVG